MKQRGANIIEFALTLPFFVLLFLGVIDYGWVYASQAGINAAASMACREGAMVDANYGSPIDTAKLELNSRAAPWCNGKTCVVAVTPMYDVPDRALECSVQLPFTPLAGFVPHPTMLQATAIYRLEWQRSGSL